MIFLHPEDMKERGIHAEQPVTITSHLDDKTRTAEMFLAIPYDTPKGCAAAYYPEANVLVPADAVADISQPPVSKSVIITVEPRS